MHFDGNSTHLCIQNAAEWQRWTLNSEMSRLEAFKFSTTPTPTPCSTKICRSPRSKCASHAPSNGRQTILFEAAAAAARYDDVVIVTTFARSFHSLARCRSSSLVSIDIILIIIIASPASRWRHSHRRRRIFKCARVVGVERSAPNFRMLLKKFLECLLHFKEQNRNSNFAFFSFYRQ